MRHPLAALGFLFGLRSDILDKEPKTAEWLFDLLAKLGREDDAYHSTCLVLMDYSTDPVLSAADEQEPTEGILEPGPQPIEDPAEGEIAHLPDSTVEAIVKALPKVSILEERTPDDLSPTRFLTSLVTRVLAATPVNMHEEARDRRGSILARKQSFTALASGRFKSKRSERSTSSLRALERTEKLEQVSRVEVRHFDGGEMSAAVVFIPMDDVEFLVSAVAQNGIGWEYSNPRWNLSPWQRRHHLFFGTNFVMEIRGRRCCVGQPV